MARPRKHRVAIEEGDPIRPTYDSMAACAGATKIPMALLKLGKRSGCSAFDGAGRVHLAPFLEWVFSRDDSVTDWAGVGKKFDALNKELAFKRASGVVVDRDEVDAGIRACVATMFSELDKKFLNELPPSLKGRGEVDIRNISAAAIEELKERLRVAFAKMVEEQKPVEA